MFAIGIMSGTSCDGVDALLLELPGADVRCAPVLLGSAFIPYSDALRAELQRPGALITARISELNFQLALIYEQAVRQIAGWERAMVVGCHGQTLWHAPPSTGATAPHTMQIGSGPVLAQRLGLPVVSDVRAADMANGGEGAPIAPVAHWYFTPEENDGRMIVNVGGIANVTHVTAGLDEVWASDVGPGGMIADALCSAYRPDHMAFDRDGEFSRTGVSNAEVVRFILSQAFFERPFPKSTGREEFGAEFVARMVERFADVPGQDLVRSALEATAEAISQVARKRGPTDLLISGGGARNPTLIEMIRQRVPTLEVTLAREGVFAPSQHEPAAMALIAVRTLHRLPSSLPRVTGAKTASILGSISWP